MQKIDFYYWFSYVIFHPLSFVASAAAPSNLDNGCNNSASRGAGMFVSCACQEDGAFRTSANVASNNNVRQALSHQEANRVSTRHARLCAHLCPSPTNRKGLREGKGVLLGRRGWNTRWWPNCTGVCVLDAVFGKHRKPIWFVQYRETRQPTTQHRRTVGSIQPM